MKKLFFYFFVLQCFIGLCQEDAWVYFVDKPDADFYFNNPTEMLSQRALDRRQNQGIGISFTDVPIHQSYINTISTVEGIEVKAKSKWMNCVHVRGDFETIQSLAQFEFVSRIDFADKTLNNQNRTVSKNLSRQRKVNKQFELQSEFNYGNSTNQVQMLNAHLLHQQNFTGTNKVIAVMDAGFPGVDTVSPFQRIRDNNQLLGGFNFVDRSTNIYTRNQHGTMVLSTIAGYVDNQLVGTAPDASFYLFITEDAGSENPVEESYWVEAAEMADSLGVDIINTSLGYMDYDNPNYSHSYESMDGETTFIARGADIAFSKGMICVTSAGNSGAGNNPYIATPADAKKTITVGAVKPDETYASFSSIGPSFDGRIKPEVMAQGQSSVVAFSNGVVGLSNGTSFSGPIMAGAVACLWQAVPWANNQQIADFVIQSADRFSNPDFQYGYGIPNFDLALDSANLLVTDFNAEYFLCFPNPVKNKFTVLFPSSQSTAEVFFFNNLGQLISSVKLAPLSNNVDLSSFPQGVYYYQIKGSKNIQKGQLIKY